MGKLSLTFSTWIKRLSVHGVSPFGEPMEKDFHPLCTGPGRRENMYGRYVKGNDSWHEYRDIRMESLRCEEEEDGGSSEGGF